MTRRLCVVLACVLAPVTLLSACGGSGNGNTKTGAVTGLSIAQAKASNKAAAAKTLAECKSAADNPGLDPVLKPLMDMECQAIKTNDLAALHTVDRQLCVAQANLKPEPLRTTLLAQCKTL